MNTDDHRETADLFGIVLVVLYGLGGVCWGMAALLYNTGAGVVGFALCAFVTLFNVPVVLWCTAMRHHHQIEGARRNTSSN